MASLKYSKTDKGAVAEIERALKKEGFSNFDKKQIIRSKTSTDTFVVKYDIKQNEIIHPKKLTFVGQSLDCEVSFFMKGSDMIILFKMKGERAGHGPSTDGETRAWQGLDSNPNRLG
jgi:hypothetical protein